MVASGCFSYSVARLSSDAGRGEEALFVAEEDVLAVGEELQHAGHFLGAGPEAVAAFAGACLKRRVDDRPVAGAAAQVAGDPVVHLVARHAPVGALVKREQRHDEARRAEAALRAVVLDHRELHGMQRAVLLGEVLDRHHLAAVHLSEQHDAGVDRLVHQLAVAHTAERDRAGAAIALATALLGAGGALALAQIIEKHHRRGNIDQFDQPAATNETHGRTHQLPRYVE